MRNSYLLDTHALIWFLADDPILLSETKSIISEPSNSILVSTATLWEIAIKVNLGKLELNVGFSYLANILTKHRIGIIQIEFEHILSLMNLENIHRDPFDRIIIAQSITEGLPIITKDKKIARYKGVEVIW
jgi:PIN domain nuclease of toxin-antitoxin system